MGRAVTTSQFNVSRLHMMQPKVPRSPSFLTLLRSPLVANMEADVCTPATKTLSHKPTSDLHGYCAAVQLMQHFRKPELEPSKQWLHSMCAVLGPKSSEGRNWD